MNTQGTFISIFLFGLLIYSNTYAQIDYTANDVVPSYNESFNIGSNMGAYGYIWRDENIADLLVGNSENGVVGIGCNSLRLALPDHFIEKYKGTHIIRQETFDYYGELGAINNTLFVEGPSDGHREQVEYCPSNQSKMFANMYLPIWDNGENDTPINDENYYASYIYWVATNYSNIKFWEIINEPDFSYSSGANLGPGEKDNWWDNDPDPCVMTNLYAPIQSYIRTLKIAYEVIKYVDEEDYVCVGGIGFLSFLDAVLRNSDNPSNGEITDEFMLKGGAYFDCLSFHSYPQYFLRDWSNDIGGFKYKRHSDAAVEILIAQKKQFEDLLFKYGYNGVEFPMKRFINTETNIPSKEFDVFIGSHEAQRNYVMKALIISPTIGLDALYVYATSDLKPVSETQRSFDLMGFYESLRETTPYNQVIKPSGIGYRNVSHFIKDKHYSKAETMALNLPNNTEGAAFVSDLGQLTYALWAKTSQDKNEQSSFVYSFPDNLTVGNIIQYNWDFTESGDSTVYVDNAVNLHGYPTFFKLSSETKVVVESEIVTCNQVITPNGDGINDFWEINELWRLKNSTVSIYDFNGSKVFENKGYDNTWNARNNGSELPEGAYYYIIEFHESGETQSGGIRVIR